MVLMFLFFFGISRSHITGLCEESEVDAVLNFKVDFLVILLYIP